MIVLYEEHVIVWPYR